MVRENTESKAFGARLRDLLRSRGLVSQSSRSGVDVSALAEAAGTTYEMARRYAEGQALPRPDKLAAIASWLRVDPAELAWGASKGGGVDMGVLQKCIEAVSTAQEKTGRSVTTERAAKLVALLYQEAMTGTLPEPASIELMVKAAG